MSEIEMADDGTTPEAPGAGTPPWLRLASIALGAAITLIALAWAIDLPLMVGSGFFDGQALATILGLAFALIYLRFPALGSGPRTRVPWYDVLAALAGIAMSFYFTFRYEELSNEWRELRDEAFVISIVILPLVVEGLRRTSGWSLVAVLSFFLVYGVIGQHVPGKLQGTPVPFVDLVAYLGIVDIALLSLPMKIVSFVVVLFIFMGRLLLVSGASEWFTDVAAALMGRSRGGAAKIAVVASGLFGSISGSAVSNVASTGVLTIPLMRKAGYSRAAAGAIEAVASTGGQIMPPIMGAAAFLMAEILEVSYGEVIIAALIPALLYYISVFIQADLVAARQNIQPVPEDKIPPLGRVLKEGWFFSIPFVALILALFWLNMTPNGAAFYAAISIPIVSMLFGYKGKRMNLRDIWNSVAESGQSSVDIIMIGAMAGLIIGVLEITGLGFALTLVLTEIGENSLFLLLALTAFVSIILGMGMPTSAIYFLLAIMVAPPLVELGLLPMAAHLFVLYYGLMSMITPPVAIAAFTGAKLAGAGAMETAVTACRLGWIAYIMPFVFVLSPELIMVGSPLAILLTFAAAVAGVWVGSAGMMGYFLDRLNPLQRAAFLVSGLVLLLPLHLIEGGIFIRIGGAVLAALLVGREMLVKRRRQAEVAEWPNGGRETHS